LNRANRLPLLVLMALLAYCQPALADTVTLRGRVVSVREGQAYLELERPVRIKIGARIELVKEARVASAVIAVSTKWIVVEVPEGLALSKGDVLRLSANVAAPATPDEEDEDAEDRGAQERAPVQLGRRRQRPEGYQPPEFRKVAFRNLSLPEAGSDMDRKGEAGEAEEPGPDAPPRPGGRPPRDGDQEEPLELEARQDLPPANEVDGELEVGFDSLSDDSLGLDRVTPYGRMRFEIRRLGGSDRARLFFYGSVRHAFDGKDDWTGHHDDQLVARVSAAVLEINAVPEEQIQGFSDRIELALGRDTIPGLVQAGLVDGARFGLRFGSFTVYGFGGGGVSPNPQREDYDSIIYGGGVRFSESITHVGSFYFNLGGAQERFRLEGERDFVEASAGLRLGGFGLDGAAVVDLFDQLRDKEKTYLSFGMANIYWQAAAAIRFEGGYREIRPTYQADMVSRQRLNRDHSDPALIAAFALAGQASSDLDPIVADVLERSVRRNAWGGIVLRFGGTWTLVARGDYMMAPESRDATGGYVSLTKDSLITNDRLSVEGSLRHRLKGNGITNHATDAFAQVRYMWFGDSVDWGLAGFFRSTNPEELGDQRFGARITLDADLTDWLELHAYGSMESRRVTRNAEEIFLAGASLSAKF
jgi:hypothetical protein